MVSFTGLLTSSVVILSSMQFAEAAPRQLKSSHFEHTRAEMTIFKLEGLDVNSVDTVVTNGTHWWSHDGSAIGLEINDNSTYSGYEEGNGYIVSATNQAPIGTFLVSPDIETIQKRIVEPHNNCCSITICGKKVGFYVS